MAEIIIDKLLDVNGIKAEIDAIAKHMSEKFGSAANINSLSGGGTGGGGKGGKQKEEFDAIKKAVEELVAARKKLTVAEQYDYQEVVRLQLERKKLLETYKQEALALDGKSKAQIKAAKDAETALKKEISLNEKAAKEAQRVADAQTKAIMHAADAHEKSQNRLINLEIKKEEAINRLNARKDASNEKSLQKEIDIANKRIQKELDTAEKISQARRRADAKAGFALTPEQKATSSVANSNTAAILKLNAVAADANSTALQKMYATMKLLEIEMQSKFNPALTEQSKEFQNLNAQHAKLQQEYQRTARATGVMGRSMNSTYGSTFQLTQVMRELPNFAIDARIGFMALSNNLPMLADSFKQLKQQIIDTEGAAGASRKTWAVFGKSLLSLNTIMIVASTLLVLFGDDIVGFIGKIFKGEKAIRAFSKSMLGMLTIQETLYKTIKDGGGIFLNAIDSINKMRTSLENSKGNTKESKYYLDEYNKSLGVTFGSATNVDGALKLITKNQDDYIMAMKKMAFANEFFSESAKSAVRIAGINKRPAEEVLKEAGVDVKKEQEKIKEYNKIIKEASTKDFMDVDDSDRRERLYQARAGKELTRMKNARIVAKERGRQILLEKKHQEDMLKNANKFAKESSDLWDKNGWGFPQDKPTGGAGGDKEMKVGFEFDMKREFYDEELVEMQKRAAVLEEEINNELTAKTVAFYKERKDAILEYYNLKQILMQHSQSMEEEDIIESDKAKKKDLEDKHKANEKLYKEGEMTKARFIELTSQYDEALLILDENTTAKLFEVADKYMVETEKSAQKSVEIIKKYFEQVQAQMPTPEGGIKTPTVGLKVTGGGLAPASPKKVTDRGRNDVGGMPADALDQMLNKEAELYERGLSTYSNYTKKKNEILDAANQQAIDFTADTEQRLADIEQDKIQTQIELAQIAVDAISEIWKVFYDYLEEQVDKQLNKDTKINDERLEQYEDETAVGLHTQKELSDFKERNLIYQEGLEEEAARKKAELEKQNFIAQQAFALAQIWLNYAMTQAEITRGGASIVANIPVAGLVAGPAYVASASALSLTSAIAASALIAAQTIRAFAEGGDMDKAGTALLGDGGKHELAISPSGKMFISSNTPQLYELEKGTHIFPDVNKVDLMSVLAMKQVMPNLRGDNRTEALLQSIDKSIKGQKQGNFYGMPLIRQMNMSDRYSARKRGLLN